MSVEAVSYTHLSRVLIVDRISLGKCLLMYLIKDERGIGGSEYLT